MLGPQAPNALAPDDRGIDWHHVCPDPVALVLLPWSPCTEHPGGTTIVKRNRNGALHGCRDVTAGPHHASIVQAWIEDAQGNGLPVEDLR